MKLRLFFCLLFGLHIVSCTKDIKKNNIAPANSETARTAENEPTRTVSNQSTETVESSPPPNTNHNVFFDGKNYIKKNGWKKPPKKDAYKDENYGQGDREGVTKSGKQIGTKTYHYLIRPLWLHSQDFIYEGRELDNMKGKLEASFFLETSASNKVFSYSISVKKVESAPPSDGDHWEPFIYEIMDADGDGIFETLLGDYDEIIVPNWVLRTGRKD